MGNIGWAQLLIVAVIVLVIFGSKKLRNLGGDLGESVKGFKKAMNKDEASTTQTNIESSEDQNVDANQTTQAKDKEQV